MSYASEIGKSNKRVVVAVEVDFYSPAESDSGDVLGIVQDTLGVGSDDLGVS